METQLRVLPAALDKNSRDAMEWLGRLQTEITRRAKSIEDVETKLAELRNQRTLLELTDQQKRALHLALPPENWAIPDESPPGYAARREDDRCEGSASPRSRSSPS